MADPEHVALLNQGTDVWNRWRKDNPDNEPNLRGANLSGLDLSGVDLRGVHLVGADLTATNLEGADLTRAVLAFAILSAADLTEADLTEAALVCANFTTANLAGAAVGGVSLMHTVFGMTNLTNATGLESCIHFGPSIIDHDTLVKSWPLPLSFLRGCGLPDNLIDYLPSLLAVPIQFYSCFISFSSRNQRFAQRLHADLQDSGVRCWFSPEDLKIGAKHRPAFDEQIRLHDKLLLILSKHSVESDWVEQEVETALARERKEKRTVLFPIRLDDAVMKIESGWPALIRNTRNIGDFCRWKGDDTYQVAFERLLRDLTAGTGNPCG